MANDSDEDVIFTNSPLMKHLEEAGIDVTSENINQTLPREFTHKSPQATCIPSDLQTSGIYVKWQKGPSLVTQYIDNFIGLSGLKEEVKIMEHVYKEKLLKISVKSKALETDDQQFLENFSEDFLKQEPVATPVLKSKVIFMVALPCVLAYLISRILFPDLPWAYKTLTDLSAFCTLLYIVINIMKYCVVEYKKWTVERYYDQVLNCFKSGESMVKFMQKSLRLIQESELVSRGFTLVSQKSPVSRIEQNTIHQTQRQCPQLRATLFHTTKKCFLQLKSTTQILVESCPLDDTVDNVMNYLCHIPLEEFGQCLQASDMSEDSDKQLYRLTDGFSVASLKGLKHLCHLQQSEFLRRLTLTFIETDISSSGVGSTIANVSKDTTVQLQENYSQLQRSYNIHSCCSVNEEPKSPRLSATDTSPIQDVHVAVHSLDLHLQAALLRVRSLSTIMEHHIEKVEQEEESHFEISNDNLLKQIKQELLACKGCWEEGLNRVTVLMKPKGVPDQGDKVHTEKNKPLEPKPIKQCGLEDPVIEDEVFEAYIDDEDNDLIDNTWDEFLSPEEKEKKRKEKEEALRVLTELKSVISVRAEDTAKREQAALLKSKRLLNPNELKPKKNSTEDGGTDESQAHDTNNVNKTILNDTNGQATKQGSDSEETTPVVTPVNEKPTDAVGSGSVPNHNNQGLDLDEEHEIKMKPRKQKYVYCPPENEMATSIGPIPGPQFFKLPVLGKQEVPVVEERLERLSGANLPFASMVAAQAVAQSQRFGLNMQTFGDQDDNFTYDSSDNNDCKSEDSLDNDSLNNFQSEGSKGDEHFNDSLQTDETDSIKDDFCKQSNHDSDIDDNDSLCGDKHDQLDLNHDSDDSLEVNNSFSIEYGKQDETM